MDIYYIGAIYNINLIMRKVKIKYDERSFRPSIKFNLREGILLELKIRKKESSLEEFFKFLRTLPYSKVDLKMMDKWYYEGRMRS